jgi:hypothetical protein
MPAHVIVTPLKGRPPTRCLNCDKVHRHRDDAVFCSKYSFRVTIDTEIPSHCKQFNRRIGPIVKASLVKIEGVVTERGILYKEHGGVV